MGVRGRSPPGGAWGSHPQTKGRATRSALSADMGRPSPWAECTTIRTGASSLLDRLLISVRCGRACGTRTADRVVGCGSVSVSVPV
jgi:hypothetical protein